MKYTTEIRTCLECHHSDHSGAFTPGGAQQICGHPTTVRKRGCDWKARVLPFTKTTTVESNGSSSVKITMEGIPAWCPLRATEVT
jgi:hypothetical protein